MYSKPNTSNSISSSAHARHEHRETNVVIISGCYGYFQATLPVAQDDSMEIESNLHLP